MQQYRARPSILWRHVREDVVEILDRQTQTVSAQPAAVMRAYEFCATPRTAPEIRDACGLDGASWQSSIESVLVDNDTFSNLDAGSRVERTYETLAQLFPHERFIFMNHGYLDPDGGDDLSWMHAADRADPVTASSLNLVHAVLSHAEISGARVADIGCGRGGTCSYVVRYARPSRVIGLDYARGNVDFCRRRHREPALSFLRADAQVLPLADESVDVVVNIESSHCYPNLHRFFAEVWRVTRADGTFLYTDCMRRTEIDFYSRHLVEAGFRIAAYRDLAPFVGAALSALREDYRNFWRSMPHESHDNRDAADMLGRIPEGAELYLNGRLAYPLWVLRKVA
jgi:ubiquinone/menaquinone biosynthesis C-methylase UbiE